VSQEDKTQRKTTADSFGELIKTFGNAVSEIFDDPKLKEKAKEFAESATESAKVFGSRFKDEEVKARFGEVGKAAQDFGKSVADCFKAGKGEKGEKE
jgi:ribosomal-protein-alanine N-acetyltransferase